MDTTQHLKVSQLHIIVDVGSESYSLLLCHIEHLLQAMEQRIMTKISEFAQRQAEFYRAQGEAVDSIVSSVSGLTGDFKSLSDQIAALQASSGTFTPEDQAAMDKLEADTAALTSRLTSVSTELRALDAMTPPVG